MCGHGPGRPSGHTTSRVRPFGPRGLARPPGRPPGCREPDGRGHGYIDEILAEGTRILAAEGAQHIRASTDLGNVPMARAFHRAGWTAIGHEINMTWT
jgi:hypothetical protein